MNTARAIVLHHGHGLSLLKTRQSHQVKSDEKKANVIHIKYRYTLFQVLSKRRPKGYSTYMIIEIFLAFCNSSILEELMTHTCPFFRIRPYVVCTEI